jgi:uncharacterized membrane protein
MMIIADVDPLWTRIVGSLIPWMLLTSVIWMFVRWQSRVTSRMIQNHVAAVEKKLDRIIELLEINAKD